MNKRAGQSARRVIVSPRMLKAGAAALADHASRDPYALVAAIYRAMVSEAARADADRTTLPSNVTVRET
jgi:hypothetical protein